MTPCFTGMKCVHGPCNVTAPRSLWLGSRITWPGSLKENRSLAWMPDWVVAFLVPKLCHKTYIMCTCTRTESNPVRMFPCMLIAHKDHTSTILYIVIVMTHVIALEAWQSSQGSLEHIAPPQVDGWALVDNIVPISIRDWGWGGGGVFICL